MSPLEFGGDMDRPLAKKVSAGEALLLGCSLASLVLSCLLWSSHKQAWMDEIFTWKEVSDHSLFHLYYAIRHGADGGMPLFYTTAWLWAKVFGTGILTLRLYSCVAMCGALLITWRTIRRFNGTWATSFGVLTIWGTSALLLNQNAEARFYGLYMLTVAIAVNIYARVITQAAPAPRLLVATFLCQAALVSSHVLGAVYGGLILLAIILFDVRKHRRRFKLYFWHAAGWLALLLWVPAIRASMAASRPRPWIEMPAVRNLLTAYLFQSSTFSDLKAPSHNLLYMIVLCAAVLVVFVPLVSVFLLESGRSLDLHKRSDPNALLLVAYALLSAPLVLFVLSRLITPVFVPRYFLPSSIGLAIVLAGFASALGADAGNKPSVMWVSIVLFLMVSPILSALASRIVNTETPYLDVQRLERVVPSNTAVVVSWANDFTKAMRYSHNPLVHYYFLLDWPSALVGPRGMVLHYHLLQAYRDNGYYPENIEESHRFLCSHPDFLLLDSKEESWFDLTIRRMPQFEWAVIDTFDAPDWKRSLIAVHRKSQVAFCN